MKLLAGSTSSPGQGTALVLLICSLIYVGSTPSALISLAVSDGWLIHFARLYAKPLVLFAFLAALALSARSHLAVRIFVTTSAAAALGFVYAGMDLMHYGAEAGVVQFAKDVLYNKVTASFFVACLMFGIFSIGARHLGLEPVLRTVIYSATAFACLSVILWLIHRGGWYQIGDHGLTQNNFQVYESVAVLLLLLFVSFDLFHEKTVAFMVLVHAAIPVILNSRGGKLIALYLLGAYIALELRSQNWRDLLRRPGMRAVIAGMIVLLLSLPGGFNIIGTGLQERLETLVWSPLLRHNVDSNTLISLNDDVVSLYSRVGTTILAVKAFMDAPLSGIGIWNAYSDIEVANFGIHGLLPLILAAYGSIGLLPVFGLFLISGTYPNVDAMVKLHCLMALVMVSLLLNVFPWWLGVLLWGFGARRMDARTMNTIPTSEPKTLREPIPESGDQSPPR